MNRNGGWRNFVKLGDEGILLMEGMKEHYARAREDKDSHGYVNLFVEARRISPYFIGHVDAVLYPIMVTTIIAQAIALYLG